MTDFISKFKHIHKNVIYCLNVLQYIQFGRIIGKNTNQPPSLFPQRNKLLNKLSVKVNSQNFAIRFEKYFPLDKNFDSELLYMSFQMLEKNSQS